MVFEFVDMYSRFLCVGPHNLECVQGMVLPPPAEQVEAVGAFARAMAELGGNMDGLEAVFFKLILAHDERALADLVQLVGAHNTAGAMIEAIIEHAREITVAPLEGAVQV